jgi:hypothetical protein
MVADKDNDAIQNAEHGTKSTNKSKKCKRPFQTRFPARGCASGPYIINPKRGPRHARKNRGHEARYGWRRRKETCVKSVMIPLRLSMHIPSLTMLVQFSARSTSNKNKNQRYRIRTSLLITTMSESCSPEGNTLWIVRRSKPISHR